MTVLTHKVPALSVAVIVSTCMPGVPVGRLEPLAVEPTRADARAPRPGRARRGSPQRVVKLNAEGHSGREIAELLHISEHTVERHREHILDELRDRVAVTRYAIRRGLVQP